MTSIAPVVVVVVLASAVARMQDGGAVRVSERTEALFGNARGRAAVVLQRPL